MSWSPDEPTEPGVYWFRRSSETLVKVCTGGWVELFGSGTELRLSWCRSVAEGRPMPTGLWWGPLEPPPLPGESVKNHVRTGEPEDA